MLQLLLQSKHGGLVSRNNGTIRRGQVRLAAASAGNGRLRGRCEGGQGPPRRGGDGASLGRGDGGRAGCLRWRGRRGRGGHVGPKVARADTTGSGNVAVVVVVVGLCHLIEGVHKSTEASTHRGMVMLKLLGAGGEFGVFGFSQLDNMGDVLFKLAFTVAKVLGGRAVVVATPFSQLSFAQTSRGFGALAALLLQGRCRGLDV